MLTLLGDMFEKLESADINYCHWKSNATLDEAVQGIGDLDLLVDHRSASKFQAILFDLGFKLVTQPSWAAHASIFHYFGLDHETGKIVHVHAYFKLITGGVLQKNLRLPLEGAMLETRSRSLGVRVPSLPAELAAMTLRKMFEASSLLELTLLMLDWKHVKSEIDWLLSHGDHECQSVIDESYRLVREAIPTIERDLYYNAVAALRTDTGWLDLHKLGRKMFSHLRSHSIQTGPFVVASSAWRAMIRVACKFSPKKHRAKRLFTAGKVVGIVGPEASGKSTITSSIASWLGKVVDVNLIHTGKPSVSFLTWLPNFLVHILRKLRRDERFSRHERADDYQSNDQNTLPNSPLMLRLYALRSWCLAYDRYRAVKRAHRWANSGRIVICDRYPTAVVGAMDSPRLSASHPTIMASKFLSWISRKERRLYESMPRADLIVRLAVPVELAVYRNRERVKADKEGEEFVRLRHSKWEQQEFDCRDIVTIDTSQNIEQVFLEAKQDIWQRL